MAYIFLTDEEQAGEESDVVLQKNAENRMDIHVDNEEALKKMIT